MSDAKKEIIEEIAKNIFRFETLETRKSDRLDFHDVAVWQIKAALSEAFHAGEILAIEERNLKIAELEKKIAELQKQATADSWAINPERMGR